MKSPFPGMDPYIEGRGLWGDFRFGLMSEIERAIAEALPERYFVEFGHRSYICLEGISSGGEAERDTDTEAVTMRAFREERFRENYIEIHEFDDGAPLVTCIDILSPPNKRRGMEGWEIYLRRRNFLLLGSVNFVEIDLLRAGQRMPMMDPWPNSTYYLLVARKNLTPSCRVLPAHYRRALPEIPIPLAHFDADIILALQPIVDAIYARNRYGRRLDYTKPLAPPLSGEDAGWLSEQLAKRP